MNRNRAFSIYVSTTQELNLRTSDPILRSQCTSFALLVARSIPFCLHDEFKSSGPMVIIPVLRLAMQWLEHIGMEREFRWCEQIFKRAIKGGNPFRDEGDEDDDSEGERDEGGSVYKLVAPRYGADRLKLEFYTRPEDEFLTPPDDELGDGDELEEVPGDSNDDPILLSEEHEDDEVRSTLSLSELEDVPEDQRESPEISPSSSLA